MKIFFCICFLILGLPILILLYWIHVVEIMRDVAIEEAEEYIENEVDERFGNAEIRVKQQLFIIDKMKSQDESQDKVKMN